MLPPTSTLSAYLVKKDVKPTLKATGKLQGLRPGFIVTFIHCFPYFVTAMKNAVPVVIPFASTICIYPVSSPVTVMK